MGYDITWREIGLEEEQRGRYWNDPDNARDSLNFLLEENHIFDVKVNGQRYHRDMKLPEEKIAKTKTPLPGGDKIKHETNHSYRLVRNNKVSESEVFSIPEPPESLIKVKDRDGYVWERNSHNQWKMGETWLDRWSELLDDYGPLTAVEYKKEPPNEYDLVKKVILNSYTAADTYIEDYHSGPMHRARQFIKELKDYYGIEDNN